MRLRFGLASIVVVAGTTMAPAADAAPFPIRGTLPWHNFLSGPTAWDEKEYEAYLDRMKELGLNLIAFHCYTGGAERYAPYVEPLIRIEYRDVVPLAGLDTSLTARWGYRPLALDEFPFGIAEKLPRPEGAHAFGAACAVTAATNEERYEKAQALMRRVLEMAHARGIQMGMGFEFGIHPPEFASIVPPGSWIRGAMLPDPTHPASIEILRATIDDILRAYPGIDWIWLWLHEHTMYVGKAQGSGSFQKLIERDGALFDTAGGEAGVFNGVWALAYIRLAQAYLAEKAPKVRIAISGWGGGIQLPGILRGLDRALPREIVFTCLSPGQGWEPPPDVLGEIAKNREVWAIPWLEGDAKLWHLQPRVALLREHVLLARKQNLGGVIAIHWRTEETRANLDAFARFARDPENPPTVEAFYREDTERRFGSAPAADLAPLLAEIDREGWLNEPDSPEYFPYEPAWGRISPALRQRLTEAIATIEKHGEKLAWHAADLRFTLLLDEVSRAIEPAYRLKERWLTGSVPPADLRSEAAAARKALDVAPVEALFRTYASRVRSRGEMGVLSALAQKLWLQVRELEAFLGGDEAFTNSLGMRFVRVEPGTFRMGQDEGGDFDERPAHTVRITKPFLISVTEVTNAQYEDFDPGHRAFRGKHKLSNGDDEAVVYVSWHDAVRFCAWLTEKERKPCRLPTEAEWEYACRAGTTTAYHTGDTLPDAYHKQQKQEWSPVVVPLQVGKTPPNAWGLHDMHGNVEEWCLDWYGPYEAAEAMDPAGRAEGEFKVTRGGSHTTLLAYLRSANRAGAFPEDRHWLIGFRVVIADPPATAPLPPPPPPLWARDVRQDRFDWSGGPDPEKPYFRGPREYVKVPAGMNGPLFSRHNHCPGLTACPNGDLLAIWYTTNTEPGRELAIAASRLRRGSEGWDPASPFWDAPDRNDHASALLWDGESTLFHFNGLSTDATWGKLALVMRTSTDNGATWSKARLIDPDHGLRNMPIAGVFRMKDGTIILPCDAVTGGSGGTAIHVSADGGKTWIDPGGSGSAPRFAAGSTGAWIAGIHAAVAEIGDGGLLAFGRGDAIDGRMPKSISSDLGKTWTYSASEFPTIGGGQRAVLRRLREGPLFFACFAARQTLTDAAGNARPVSGLFGALSFDDGATWPVRRLITDDGPPRSVDGGGNTHLFTLGPDSAEPRGYLACVQTPDGVIHLISSKQHYAFNLAWLKTPMPAKG